MANGDDLKIGGFKELKQVTSGMEGAGNTVTPQTLPNTDYNTSRANQTNNQNQFLSLTAQHTTTRFTSQVLDNYDHNVGSTGTNTISSPQVMQERYNAAGAGLKLFSLG